MVDDARAGAPCIAPVTAGAPSRLQTMGGNDTHDLTARLRALAAERPAAPALLAPHRATMSFASLVRHVDRIVSQLATWGIGRGDVVAWSNDDRVTTAGALAILPASATIAPLGPAMTYDALCDTLARLAPKAVVAPAGRDSAIVRAAASLEVAVLLAETAGHAEAGAFDLVLASPAASLDRARRFPGAWACIGATSGATGKPKLVSHGHRQVIATALCVGARLGIGPGDVSGHITPLHLAGGIRNAYFQSLANGGAVNCLPVGDVVAFVEAIAAGEVTFTSASFTILRELLARLEAGLPYSRGRLRFVRAASGRMEDDEMDRLEARLGVPVVAGLASSEAGSIAQQALDAPRRRGSVGRPLDGEVRIVDDDGRVVAPGAIGEIQARGPQLFDGYVDDDALNASSFSGGWFRMGDLGRIDERGELELVGRLKDVINRGGDKIAPLEIDAELRALAGVADAAAFGIPHPRLGEEVVAAVVPSPGTVPDGDALLAALHARLGAQRSPRRLWFVDALPRNEGGKLVRSALPAWVGYEAPPRAPAQSATPATPLESAVAALWSAALGRAEIGRDTAFGALGGDDDTGARLVDQVREAFGVDVPADALRDRASTVSSMARLIERALGGADAPA